jgi:hypothetical protein
MLTIHPHQLSLLDQHQEQRFRASLCRHIQQTYPAYARLSPVMLTRLIGFGLARARRYGFTWQASLGSFVYLMAAVAPDFDRHPAIHALLVNTALSIEGRLAALTERLPPGVWTEASRAAGTIGWFLSQDSFSLDRPARIGLALANALPDNAASLGEEALQGALKRAETRGFLSEDSQFVFAACGLHYGEQFEHQAPWAKGLFSPALTMEARTALLRVRLVLDAGIWL